MDPVHVPGLFEVFLPTRAARTHRFRFHFEDGATWESEDPYRFPPRLGPMDEHLFAEGTHRRLADVLGAHPESVGGVSGVAFAVWAPGVQRVSVVGEFCSWDGLRLPMRERNAGLFELFVPASRTAHSTSSSSTPRPERSA